MVIVVLPFIPIPKEGDRSHNREWSIREKRQGENITFGNSDYLSLKNNSS